MLSSLLRGLVDHLLGGGQLKKGPPSPNHGRSCAPPRLEPLEDRCLLSAAESLPTLNDIPLLLQVGDAAMLSQVKGGTGVVFLGDSITWRYAYDGGAPVWSAVMAPLGAVNYGVNFQTTQGVLFQLSLGQLAGMYPLEVVLTIGTNDLLDGATPAATAAGILADVRAIHAWQPQAQVLVLGVPPGAASPNDPYRLQVNQTDALVSQMLAGDPGATFLNIAPALEQPDGTISSAVMFDQIHPTTLGYVQMTNALVWPVLDSAMLALQRIE
jgi:lysophospholipase L1-like esterase